jgi:DNA-binding NarL/FixJ family response regulator
VTVAVVGVVRDLLVREGLVRVLSELPEFEFAALRPDDPRLPAAVVDADRQVVIMDVGWTSSARDASLEFAVAIVRQSSTVGLIALSIEPDLDVARALFERGVAGRGYLLHDRLREHQQLAAAIREVAAGGSAIDARIVAALIEQNRLDESSLVSRLTDRQTEVLIEVARGKSNGAIAQTLGVTKRSVEHHIAEIFSRLDLLDKDDASRRVTATLLLLRETMASQPAKTLQEGARALHEEARLARERRTCPT